MKITPVEESEFGLYVWEMPDGRVVADEDGNWLNIPSRKYDLERMKKLRDVARAHGIEVGKPLFLSGRRRITDIEHEEQLERATQGLIPDQYDAGAYREEIYGHKPGR